MSIPPTNPVKKISKNISMGGIIHVVNGRPTIAILTDFGAKDPYVGIMKGVIAGIAPEALTIDLAHEIIQGDVQRAAFALYQSAAYFPTGTIFLCVVDPGVGTSRRPIIVRTPQHLFVAPDNGLVSFIAGPDPEAWTIANEAYMLPGRSKTFHGRDIFAPAASHLASGIEPEQFGPPLSKIVRLPEPVVQVASPTRIRGEILWEDHFGNLITSLGLFTHIEDQNSLHLSPWFGDDDEVSIPTEELEIWLPNGRRIPFIETFGEVPEGELGVVLGSTHLLEIVANNASAAALTQLASGQEVYLSAGNP